ncbi:MAG: hypothetical protein IJY40_09485 [Oscillospiraceae bacterium]|nr:hypothetical protein [Oscillospiraceae bacterium]
MAKKKRIFIVLGAAVLALILAAFLLPKGGHTPDAPTAPAVQTRPAESAGTEPAPSTEPAQTQPVETEAPVTTEPPAVIQTRPAETRPAETEPEQTTAPTEAPEIFPVLLEDGMLTVQSMFQYSGMNPDADLQFGENIAGLQLVNTSDRHLTEAELAAVLDDGTILSFRAEDVPPGMTVMAFSMEHGSMEDLNRCVEVYGYAEFEEGDPLRSDLVKIQVEGIAITVTNVSGMDLTDLDIICHGLLDGSAFGGRSYTYQITSLDSGGSTTVYAMDCILGMTRVTRVELGE